MVVYCISHSVNICICKGGRGVALLVGLWAPVAGPEARAAVDGVNCLSGPELCVTRVWEWGCGKVGCNYGGLGGPQRGLNGCER